MKRYIVALVCIFVTVQSFSQNTIKFLGIPVDGTKKEMIAALEDKGYEYNSLTEFLEGEFNGVDVMISVQTVNNRVWRLAIMDETTSTEQSGI